MLIQALILLTPILLFCAVGFLIRCTEKRDWAEAQKEARALMAFSPSRNPCPYPPTRGAREPHADE